MSSNSHPQPVNHSEAPSYPRYSLCHPPPSTTVPRHNSVSSSTDSSSTTSVSPTYSALATHHENGTVSGSPASSVASPIDPKFGSTDWSNSDYPHSRQTSLSGSLSGLTGSFRWPGSNAASNVQPIAIPNSFPSLNQETHNTTPTPMVGMSAPTRRTSVGGPTFRRAFELPNYTNTYAPQDNPQDLPPPTDANRRGRSGSLFSSFGVAGDASKRTSGPPRRKLSPMGERMIRDHPF
ncbi:hypothetical protein Pst134EA_026931 [Puccinia striiformis f. sp. tritici]|uniref:hypothetical protein n=1 Tax=Puccinia striiformis f. sp. tritici TaxID=168172 RepID=UPI0020078AA2|nr:hypothetical protein Pst134EA_026931 [Puccinia striiformis f. sp. tritici]KAH9450222.1 hypothetical protein Pst134EA_026931 [Puccinia striiformis f. sp. tritici]